MLMNVFGSVTSSPALLNVLFIWFDINGEARD